MRNLRAIIISVAFIVLGVGIMSMTEKRDIVKTIGGVLFIVGTIMLSLSLYNTIRNGNIGKKK